MIVSRIAVEDFNELMHEGLPSAKASGIHAIEIGDGTATLKLPIDDLHSRPGGTVSGPSMMMLADATMYAVILSQIGNVPLAVTTNFNINFLRKPIIDSMLGEGRMIKLGRRLAVMEVTIFTEGDHDPVAHATGTYSIPPNRD